MDYIDFIVKQEGRTLILVDSSKIVINKYDNKTSRIIFELDDSISGRPYFAMLNPVTDKYKIVPIVNNHIIIDTKISAYPGRWESILVVVADDYEIVDDNIDQTKFTYISNVFKNIVVRDNFLNEDNIEEDEELNFVINEILDNLIKAQDRLETASANAVEAAQSAQANRDEIAEMIADIDEINTSVNELHDYIIEIKAAKNEINGYRDDIKEDMDYIDSSLETINNKIDSIEKISKQVTADKNYIDQAIDGHVLFVENTKKEISDVQEANMTELVNAFNAYVAEIRDTGSYYVGQIESVGNNIKNSAELYIEEIQTTGTNTINNIVNTKETAEREISSIKNEALDILTSKQNESIEAINATKSSALIDITTQQGTSVEEVTREKERALSAISSASTGKVEGIQNAESEALTAIENAKNSTTEEIELAKENALEEIESGKDEYVQQIASEKQNAITAIKNSVQNVANDIVTKRDNAIADVKEESQIQVNLIDAKAREALESIPDKYEEIYDMAREGAQKADAITCTASGKIITVDDSSDNYIRNLKLYGKTTQHSTTGKNLAIDIFSEYNTSDVYLYKLINEQNSNVTVSLTVRDASIDLSGYSFGMIENPEDTALGYTWFIYDGELKISVQTVNWKHIFIHPIGEEIFNKIFAKYDIQIEYGTEATEYEKYTGGKPSPSVEFPQLLDSKGKWGNLLNNKAESKSVSGIDYVVNKDKTVSAIGTATAYAFLDLDDDIKLENGEYVLSGGHPNFTLQVYAVKTDETVEYIAYNYGGNTEFTVDNTNVTKFQCRLYPENNIYVNTVLKPQITRKEDDITSYRPYTGQMEIESGVYGKNLFDYLSLNNGDTYTITQVENGFTITSTIPDWYYVPTVKTMQLAPNTKYTLSLDASSTENAYLGVDIKDSQNKKIVNDVTLGTSRKIQLTFMTTSDGIINICFGTRYSGVYSATYTNVQLEYGDVATNYEPYTKQSHIVLVNNGLKGIPVTDTSLATYTDEDGIMWCSDYVDCDRGVLVQRIADEIFDGSNGNFGICPDTTTDWQGFYIYGTTPDAAASELFCDKFIYSTDSIWRGTDGYKTGIGIVDKALYVNVKKTDASTVDELKTWLSSNPITIQYILATPIITPLSASEIESYKALKSNYKVTSVMNDCGAFMEVQYNADTETYVLNNTPLPSNEQISDAVTSYLDKNPVSMVETDPTVPAWAKQPNKPKYTASEVGADPSGTATSAVSNHNVSTEAHNDIRVLLTELSAKVTNLLNSDDETLDQTKEIVDYIKANRGLIESVTTEKVSVTDIINNLTTNLNNKALSAAMGVTLKQLIDELQIALNDKAPMTHSHDSSYYTKPEVDALVRNQTGVQIITWEDDD